MSIRIVSNVKQQSSKLVSTLTKNEGSAESSSDVTHVLVTSPETKDEAAIFDGFFVTEPVTHNGSSCEAKET